MEENSTLSRQSALTTVALKPYIHKRDITLTLAAHKSRRAIESNNARIHIHGNSTNTFLLRLCFYFIYSLIRCDARKCVKICCNRLCSCFEHDHSIGRPIFLCVSNFFSQYFMCRLAIQRAWWLKIS